MRELRAPEPGLTPEEVILRAREMVPWLRERAAAMENERRISDEVNQRIIASGIYRILQPRRLGGYEFDLTTYAEAIAEIARGDTSTGWVVGFNSAHTWWASQLPEKGQMDVFASDGDLRAPIAIAPQGVAKAVPGGYEITGAWDYCSGCDIGNWLGVVAPVPGDAPADPPRDAVMAFVPPSDYEIEDNWHVLGLRATGSKRAHFRGVFVPEHRTASFFALLRECSAPGHAVHPNPLYRLPVLSVLCVELSAVCIGLARAALDVFIEYAGVKRLSFPPFTPLRDLRRTQVQLGDASARLEGVTAAMYELIRRQEVRMAHLEDRSRFSDMAVRKDLLLGQELARATAECVRTVFVAAGSSAARDGNPLQRMFRDISMMSTHNILNTYRTGENFGAMALGLPPYSDL